MFCSFRVSSSAVPIFAVWSILLDSIARKILVFLNPVEYPANHVRILALLGAVFDISGPITLLAVENTRSLALEDVGVA